MAPPVFFLLAVVLIGVVIVVMFVAGIGPFAAKKAQEPEVDMEEDPRPVHDIPHREQFAREKWRMFPPVR